MRSIWAVAINTIKQALRIKVAVVFTILLFVLLPVLGITTTGDETLKGRLQTFVSYALSLMSFLLCLLTIVVSIYSVTSDIDQRQIYTVITKPIRRFQFTRACRSRQWFFYSESILNRSRGRRHQRSSR